MRLCAALLTMGPISASSSVPFLIFRALVRSASIGMILSAASPTSTPSEIAMQRSPAEPKAEPISASTAWSMSASGITTMWFLAPPSACTRLPWCAPVS